MAEGPRSLRVVPAAAPPPPPAAAADAEEAGGAGGQKASAEPSPQAPPALPPASASGSPPRQEGGSEIVGGRGGGGTEEREEALPAEESAPPGGGSPEGEWDARSADCGGEEAEGGADALPSDGWCGQMAASALDPPARPDLLLLASLRGAAAWQWLHAGGMALLALASAAQVGLDAETGDPTSKVSLYLGLGLTVAYTGEYLWRLQAAAAVGALWDQVADWAVGVPRWGHVFDLFVVCSSWADTLLAFGGKPVIGLRLARALTLLRVLALFPKHHQPLAAVLAGTQEVLPAAAWFLLALCCVNFLAAAAAVSVLSASPELAADPIVHERYGSLQRSMGTFMVMCSFGDEWGQKLEDLWDVGGRLETKVWGIFLVFRVTSLFLMFAAFGTVCSAVARNIQADRASLRPHNQRRMAADLHSGRLEEACRRALAGVPRQYRAILQALTEHPGVQETVEEMPGFQVEGLAFLLSSSGNNGDILPRDIRHAIDKMVNQDSVSTTAQIYSALAILEREHKSAEAADLYFRDEARVEQDDMKEDLRLEFMHVTEMVRALVTSRGGGKGGGGWM